jgi:predicted xylose isomerase-like sugar epimerase
LSGRENVLTKPFKLLQQAEFSWNSGRLWLNTREVRFAICNEIFQDWTIEAVLEYCARLGYDGVEIAPFTLAKTVGDISPLQRRQLRAAAARAGLALCGLHWLLAHT